MSSLYNGLSRSCGCLKREISSETNGAKLEKQRFTRLFVMEDAGRTKRQQKLWRCICDCGKEVIVATSDLRSGHTKSCGCYSREICQAANIANRKYNQNSRNNAAYKAWQKAVYKKDNYYCQICGARTRLRAHHLEGFAHAPSLRYNTDNGITLCESCHDNFHSKYGYGDNVLPQFISWLNIHNQSIHCDYIIRGHRPTA